MLRISAVSLLVLFLFGSSWARYCVYRVKRGDTLYGIAKASGIRVSELIKVNRLRRPDRLRVGQRLLVPCRALEDLGNYCSYRVRPGDSVIRLSLKFGVPVKEILEVNNLRLDSVLRVGQILMLPCDSLMDWKILGRVKLTDREAILPSRFRLGRVSFSSPLGLQVRVAVVGKRVDIPVSRGNRIVAAATGRVIYVERSIHSMGTLVLLKHRMGYYTVYAGKGISWRAREGQYVQRGWVMGYALEDTVLRFEIMKKGRIIPPERYVREVAR